MVLKWAFLPAGQSYAEQNGVSNYITFSTIYFQREMFIFLDYDEKYSYPKSAWFDVFCWWNDMKGVHCF